MQAAQGEDTFPLLALIDERKVGSLIECLDDGFIRLVDHMGDDSSIVQAARVSYQKGTKQVSDDRGLIRYLMRNRHTTNRPSRRIQEHGGCNRRPTSRDRALISTAGRPAKSDESKAPLLQLATHRSLSHWFSRAAHEGLWIEPEKFTCTAHKGELVRAPFVVHNDSPREVKLLGAQSSCDCSVTEGTPVVVQAGGMATVTVLMRVGAPNADGKYRVETTLFVNREEAGRSLVVEATVVGVKP